MNDKNLDEIANNYENIHSSWSNLLSMVRRNEFNIFLNQSYDRENVMEIGLGDGVFTSFLSENFKNVFAVDASEKTIKIVKKNLSKKENVIYIKSYIENLSFTQKIDNIVMSHILEHLDDPIYALKTVKEVVHKDSIVYISVPNCMSIHRQVAVKMGLLDKTDSLNNTDKKLGHKRVYSPQLFKRHVEGAGFKIIEFGGSMIKPLTNNQIENNWTPEMINGFIALGKDYPEICGDIYVIAKRSNE